MQAFEARKITEKAERNNAECYWNEIKDKLFERIKMYAEGRNFAITIDEGDAELNKFRAIDNTAIREFMRNELNNLGYVVEYSYARGESELIISWRNAIDPEVVKDYNEYGHNFLGDDELPDY